MYILPQTNRAVRYTFIVLSVLLFISLGLMTREYITLTAIHRQTKAELKKATSTIAILEQKLSDERNKSARLQQDLREEKKRVGKLVDQVEDITGKVTTIEKRQKLDEELLKKYSKTFFLNEHYRPSQLDPIPQEYRYPEHEFEQFHEKALPFLTDMLEEARDDGVDLMVASGFRSFDTQKNVYDQYRQTFGSGANQFSAVQGYSEHQLGTTVDFTTPKLQGSLKTFDQTKAFEWLQENAHEYGFILSYPKDNEYYRFEPWHWRFVGTKLAEDLHEQDIHFYDMPQREIDEYLVDIFDR